MRTVQITAANADEKIKQLYETAFPEDEQIPWKDLMRLVEEMPLDFTAYYDGEEFIGFTIVYPRKSSTKSIASRTASDGHSRPRSVSRCSTSS